MISKVILHKVLNSKVFTIIFILSFLSFFYLRSISKKEEIKTNMVIATGEIYLAEMASKGGIDLTYYFTYNGQSIMNNRRLGIGSSYRNYFVKKKFPVVYSAKNVNNNQLLVLPDEFATYGMSFPDSLNWVNQLLGKF